MTRHRVAALADIPEDGGLQIEFNGKLVALFRRGGKIHAVGDECPHMGAPLSEGYMDGDTVVCPWHGWVFNLESGECPFDEDSNIPVYTATVEGEDVYLAASSAPCAHKPASGFEAS